MKGNELVLKGASRKTVRRVSVDSLLGSGIGQARRSTGWVLIGKGCGCQARVWTFFWRHWGAIEGP